jgi:hypothetical protein
MTFPFQKTATQNRIDGNIEYSRPNRRGCGALESCAAKESLGYGWECFNDTTGEDVLPTAARRIG